MSEGLAGLVYDNIAVYKKLIKKKKKIYSRREVNPRGTSHFARLEEL